MTHEHLQHHPQGRHEGHDHDGHHDDHHHHHHHGHIGNPSQKRLFVFCIVLNLLFVGIEALLGVAENSLSLLSDAGHNLSDVLSLALVLIAFHLAGARSSGRFTYGLKKSTVLISFTNAILLLLAVGAIVAESIHKFSEPSSVNGVVVSWTAGAGIVINGLTALLLMKGQKSDINVRGAFLHMVADTLVSVGVVVSGLIIAWTGWDIVDPIVSLVIAFVILVTTWDLLTASLRLLVDGTPEGLAPEEIQQAMSAVEHVEEIHHLHVWALSTTDNALTAHVVVDSLDRMDSAKAELKRLLQEKGIGHTTLEFETPDSPCHEQWCDPA